MKSFDRSISAAILFAFGCFLGGIGAFAARDGFNRFRLVSAAIACIALGVCLWRRYRWARWIALGWALDVLGNIAVALFYADDATGRWFPIAERNAFPDGHRSLALILGGGAMALIALLGTPGARSRFEEGWTSPLHRAYRWTAIAIAACVTHACVAGVFGVADQVWSPAIAACLMLIALFMLARGKVVALPVALAALLAHAAAQDPSVPPFLYASGLRSWAIGTDRWCFFVGGASSIAWVPALVITLTATMLAGPYVARELRSRPATAVLFALVASGLVLGGAAVSAKSSVSLKQERPSSGGGSYPPVVALDATMLEATIGAQRETVELAFDRPIYLRPSPHVAKQRGPRQRPCELEAVVLRLVGEGAQDCTQPRATTHDTAGEQRASRREQACLANAIAAGRPAYSIPRGFRRGVASAVLTSPGRPLVELWNYRWGIERHDCRRAKIDPEDDLILRCLEESTKENECSR
jgi:hypothetical protein